MCNGRKLIGYVFLVGLTGVAGGRLNAAHAGICQAPSFVVNTTNDLADIVGGDGVAPMEGTVSLRAAIQEINAQDCGDLGFIDLPAGIYALAITGTDEDLGATGDLDVTSRIRILGAGPDESIIDASDLDRIFDVHPGAELEVSGVGIINGQLPATGSGGGGIRNQGESRVIACRIEGCVVPGGGGGGGIQNFMGAMMNVSASRIWFNHADATGGGLTNQSNDGSSFCRITQSLFFMNTSGSNGGALLNSNATLELENVTVSANLAEGTGGGLSANNGSVTISYATITGNISNSDQAVIASSRGILDLGGGIFELGGAISIDHSIVAGNAHGAGVENIPDDVVGEIESGGHNIIQEAAGLTITGGPMGSDMIGADPILLPLADNGGSSETHALGILSPAIDASEPSIVVLDQRGSPRPEDGDGDGESLNDIGAFEAPARCQGDADGNGMVNFADITSVLNNWLDDYLPGTGQGDANLDGVVNFVDVTTVLFRWLSDCGAEN